MNTSSLLDTLDKVNQNDFEIIVFGLGYVGLSLSLRLATHGFTVMGIDTDARKIELLKKKSLDFKIMPNLDERSVKAFDCICIVQHHTKTRHLLEQAYLKLLVPLVYDCQNRITPNSKSKTVLKGFGRI